MSELKEKLLIVVTVTLALEPCCCKIAMASAPALAALLKALFISLVAFPKVIKAVQRNIVDVHKIKSIA